MRRLLAAAGRALRTIEQSGCPYHQSHSCWAGAPLAAHAPAAAPPVAPAAAAAAAAVTDAQRRALLDLDF